MPKLIITTNDDTIIEEIDLTDWNLSKSIARGMLVADIEDAIKIARREES